MLSVVLSPSTGSSLDSSKEIHNKPLSTQNHRLHDTQLKANEILTANKPKQPAPLKDVIKSSDRSHNEIVNSFLPSLFHTTNVEAIEKSKQESRVQKVRVESVLERNKDNLKAKVILANIYLCLADTNLPNERNPDFQKAIELCEEVSKENYFFGMLHGVRFNILMYKKVHFLNLEEIRAAILCLRRTLSIDPSSKDGNTALKREVRQLKEKWQELADARDITPEEHAHFKASLDQFLNQDPFEGEDIPADQLAKAPAELVRQFPSLAPKPKATTKSLEEQQATVAAQLKKQVLADPFKFVKEFNSLENPAITPSSLTIGPLNIPASLYPKKGIVLKFCEEFILILNRVGISRSAFNKYQEKAKNEPFYIYANQQFVLIKADQIMIIDDDQFEGLVPGYQKMMKDYSEAVKENVLKERQVPHDIVEQKESRRIENKRSAKATA